jgi:plasmid stability protein
MATIYVRNVPDEEHRWLQREAAKRDLSVAQLVRALIRRDYLLAAPPDRFAGIPRVVDGEVKDG